MKIQTSLLIVLICLTALSGCRGARRTRALDDMATEMRHQEDKIFELSDYVRTYHSQLEACRKENRELRKGGASSSSDRNSSSSSSRLRPTDDEEVEMKPPTIDLPDPSSGSATEDEGASGDDDTPAGDIELGPPPAFEGSNQSEAQENVDRTASHRQTSDTQPSEPVDDGSLNRITLNPIFTGGNNTDGIPGDDGLSILIEGRTSGNRFVIPAGSISVALLDPSATTKATARVARWDFTADEVSEHLMDTPFGNGIRIELPWPEGAPRRSDLRLFVRLTQADQHQLMTKHKVDIQLPGRTARLGSRDVTAQIEHVRQLREAPSNQKPQRKESQIQQSVAQKIPTLKPAPKPTQQASSRQPKPLPVFTTAKPVKPEPVKTAQLPAKPENGWSKRTGPVPKKPAPTAAPRPLALFKTTPIVKTPAVKTPTASSKKPAEKPPGPKVPEPKLVVQESKARDQPSTAEQKKRPARTGSRRPVWSPYR